MHEYNSNHVVFNKSVFVYNISKGAYRGPLYNSPPKIICPFNAALVIGTMCSRAAR